MSIFKKMVVSVLGVALVAGVGVSIASSNNYKEAKAASTYDWYRQTGEIESGKKYLIVAKTQGTLSDKYWCLNANVVAVGAGAKVANRSEDGSCILGSSYGEGYAWTFTKQEGSNSYSITRIQNSKISYLGSDSSAVKESTELVINYVSNNGSSYTIADSDENYLCHGKSGKSANSFYYLSSETALTVELYALRDDAASFAQAFLDASLCDGGVTAPSVDTWNNLASAYALVSESDQGYFKSIEANEDGNNIEKCAARYDYILAKYGTTNYSNFMERSVTPSAAANIFGNVASDNSVIVVVVASILSVSVLGLCFFLKRRKENN